MDTGFVGPEADAYKIRYKVRVNTGMRNHKNLTKCFPYTNFIQYKTCQHTARTTEGFEGASISFTVQ